MSALHLERMPWPDVQAEIEADRRLRRSKAGFGRSRKKYIDQLLDLVMRTVEES
jgi:hypothetical protein